MQLRQFALAFVVACAACSAPPGGGDAGTGGGAGGSGGAAGGGSGGSGGSGGGAAGSGGGSSTQDAGWLTRAPLPASRQETGVAALGGKIYVLGGFDGAAQVVATVEAYDPATNTWATTTPLPAAVHHANVAAVGGRLWVVGALSGAAFTATGAVWSWAPGETAWTTTHATMVVGTQRGGSAVAVLGTRIFILGGYRGGSVGDSSVFDTATGQHALLPALPATRDHLVGGAWEGQVFALGGRRNGLSSFDPRLDAFDTDAGTWSTRTPMRTARAGCAAAQWGSVIAVAGGEGNLDAGSGVFPELEFYDAATDTWTAGPNMRSPRHGTGAAAVDGVFYMPGGADVQAFGAVTTVESAPFP